LHPKPIGGPAIEGDRRAAACGRGGVSDDGVGEVGSVRSAAQGEPRDIRVMDDDLFAVEEVAEDPRELCRVTPILTTD